MGTELSRENEPKLGINPAYDSKTLTNQTTQYSWTVPEKTKKLAFHIRTLDYDLKYSFTTGGPYIIVPAGGSRILDNVYLEGKTLYLQCDGAAGKVVDIESWT